MKTFKSGKFGQHGGRGRGGTILAVAESTRLSLNKDEVEILISASKEVGLGFLCCFLFLVFKLTPDQHV